MTHDHDDAGEDVLGGIDLHMWRVPPPAAVHRPSLLVRALSPAATPGKRPRLGWIIAAIVLLNAAIATLIVILARPPAPPVVSVQPAGGGSVDAQVRELLQRLEQEQRELERKLAEIQELRTLVIELSEKVRQYEKQQDKRDRVAPKQRERQAPDRVTPPPVAPAAPPPVAPTEPAIAASEPSSSASLLPDILDRQAITKGMASVKSRVAACATPSTPKGKVKLRIRVAPSGHIAEVIIETTPDLTLGRCVMGAVQQATFPRTHHGGAFSYPFVF
jgi:hypothetical protein